MKRPSQRISLLIALVFTSFNSVSVQAEAFDPSWPLDFSIEPEDTKIANELVSDINPELTHIGLINCNNNTLSPQQCQQITESGGQLEMLVDGNHDGLFERWSIAVGKMQGGEYAKVLLVQDATSGRVLQTLLIESPMAGFSALYFQQGKVLWGMCLSCDVLADIVWGQEGYEVSWQPVLYASLRDEVLVDNR